jgi:hypothetical protein
MGVRTGFEMLTEELLIKKYANKRKEGENN